MEQPQNSITWEKHSHGSFTLYQDTLGNLELWLDATHSHEIGQLEKMMTALIKAGLLEGGVLKGQRNFTIQSAPTSGKTPYAAQSFSDSRCYQENFQGATTLDGRNR